MEDVKTNSLPNMECGMAYLAHPYTSTSHSPGQYTSPQLNRGYGKNYVAAHETLHEFDNYFPASCVFIFRQQEFD